MKDDLPSILFELSRIALVMLTVLIALDIIFPEIRKPVENEPVLTYHNNHIYIDGNKTDYTLEDRGNGVYVIKKGEGK